MLDKASNSIHVCYIKTSEKDIIQLRGKFFTIFSLNLVCSWNTVRGLIKNCLNQT